MTGLLGGGQRRSGWRRRGDEGIDGDMARRGDNG